MSSNNLGHGKVPLFPVWKGVHIGDRSKAISLNIQEAHGGNFPKDTKIDC